MLQPWSKLPVNHDIKKEFMKTIHRKELSRKETYDIDL